MNLDFIKDEIVEISLAIKKSNSELNFHEIVKSVFHTYIETRNPIVLEKGLRGVVGEKRKWGGTWFEKLGEGKWVKYTKAREDKKVKTNKKINVKNPPHPDKKEKAKTKPIDWVSKHVNRIKLESKG